MFEKLALYCNSYAELIPVSFVLGKELSGIQQGGEWDSISSPWVGRALLAEQVPPSAFVKLLKGEECSPAVSVPQHRRTSSKWHQICPGNQWLPHPWKFSRPHWVEL